MANASRLTIESLSLLKQYNRDKLIFYQQKSMNKQQTKQLLEKLVNFNTENFDNKPSGNTLDLLEFVKEYLKENDIESEIYQYTVNKKYGGKTKKLKNRGILLTKISNRKKPIILLQGHCDTVPIGKKDNSKIICSVKGDILKGRGTVDMKGSVISMILTIQELSKNKNLKYQPVLLLTSDEEANDFAGIKYFLKKKKIKNNIALAICGEPTNFEIKTNFYGALYMIIECFGKLGHSANNSKNQNAIENAIPFLNDLIKYQKEISKIHHPRLGRSIMNIGAIKGGEKVNQIPSSCVIEFAVRTVKNNRMYLNLFDKTVKNKKVLHQTTQVFSYDPICISNDNKLIRELKKSVLKFGKNPQSNVSKEFSEATLLNKAGIKTIMFGPGNPLLSHSSDEEMDIKDVLLAKEIFVDFFLNKKNND